MEEEDTINVKAHKNAQIHSNCYLCGKTCLNEVFALIYIREKLEIIHIECYNKMIEKYGN